MRKGSLQPELNGAVVGRRQFVGRRHQGAGERNAYRKAADACHDILRQHRLVVVKTQPIAQAQQPSQPVIVDLMPLDHLRLRLPARIEAVQRVKHQIGVITSLTVEGDDRVEHDEISAGRETNVLAAAAPPIRGAASAATLAPAALSSSLLCMTLSLPARTAVPVAPTRIHCRNWTRPPSTGVFGAAYGTAR